MTTYNTYQEAKIAMPLACIIHNVEDGYFLGMPSREGATLGDDGCVFAEPQDYCMTVEAFLADGNEFVAGDVVLDFGDVINIKSRHDIRVYNDPEKYDKKRYILRAAALEEKNPRTKVEYVQVGFHKCHEAMFKHEMEEKLYGSLCGQFKEASLTYISNNWQSGLYRRIETPIEWWEDAAEFVKPIDSAFIEFSGGKLKVEAEMTRDQWCDFARILLEQGE